MKQQTLLVLAASLILLASCGPSVKSTDGSTSSPEVSSSTPAYSSSETTTSNTEPSSSSSESSSSASVTPEIQTLTMTPDEFPTSSNGYPAPGEVLFGEQSFYLENVMKGTANPTQSDGTVLKKVNVDTIQMQADGGILANSTAFLVRSVVITMLDKTNAYNLAYAQPSLYYGDTANPAANLAKGTYVAGTTAEGYKTFVGTYALDKAYSYIRFVNDASSVEDTTRATTALSITFNPIAA